jgi:hypothetical protein
MEILLEKAKDFHPGTVIVYYAALLHAPGFFRKTQQHGAKQDTHETRDPVGGGSAPVR